MAFQFALAPAGLPALAAFGLVSLLALLVTLPLARLLRRLPGVRSVL